MFDETDYNNGVAPKSGLVWNGETWGWPTIGISTGTIREETLTLWPKTNALSLQEYIDLMTGSGSFDPKTGNGWVPAVDGMSEPAPEVQRTETKSVSLSFTSLAAGSPNRKNMHLPLLKMASYGRLELQ